MAEGDICASQRRASSEGLGLLARLGNDTFTARMVSHVLVIYSLTIKADNMMINYEVVMLLLSSCKGASLILIKKLDCCLVCIVQVF